jgi:hypothetical protein
MMDGGGKNMKHKTKVAVVSVRLPAELYSAMQHEARRRSLEEKRSLSGPALLRELAQREYGSNGWSPVEVAK